MRTHAKIIRDAKGPSAVARVIAERGELRFDQIVERAKQWLRLSSIPPEYWPTFEAEGWASLEELAAAAEQARQPGLAASRQPEGAAP